MRVFIVPIHEVPVLYPTTRFTSHNIPFLVCKCLYFLLKSIWLRLTPINLLHISSPRSTYLAHAPVLNRVPFSQNFHDISLNVCKRYNDHRPLSNKARVFVTRPPNHERSNQTFNALLIQRILQWDVNKNRASRLDICLVLIISLIRDILFIPFKEINVYP